MSNGKDDDKNESVAPGFAEQVKFLRKSKQASPRGYQKTTEFNVSSKLKQELADPNIDQAAIDRRLEAALNREAGKDIFENNLMGVLGKKAQPEADLHEDSGVAQETAEQADGLQDDTEAVDNTDEMVPDSASIGTGVAVAATTASRFFPSSVVAAENIEESDQSEESGSEIEHRFLPSAAQAEESRDEPVSRFFPSAAQAEETGDEPVSRFFPSAAQAEESGDEPVPRFFPAATQPEEFEAEPVPRFFPAATQAEESEAEPVPRFFPAAAQPDESGDESRPTVSNAASVQPISEETEETVSDPETVVSERKQAVRRAANKALSRLRSLFSGGPEIPPPAPVSLDYNEELAQHEPAQGADIHPPELALPAEDKQQIEGLPEFEQQVEVLQQDEQTSSVNADSVQPELSEGQLELLKNFTSLAAKFKEGTGFYLVHVNQNCINLTLQVGGDNLVAYSTDFSEEGIEEARIFADNLIDQYVNVLSTNFGLEFGEPGEVTVRQLKVVADKQLSPGKPLFARKARIDELRALHTAIEYSWPAIYQLADQFPVRVAFVNDPVVEGDESGVVLKYLEDGRPVLFISSQMWQRGKPTDLDLAPADDSESWQASIMRELAWKAAVDCENLPLSPEATESLGWVTISSAQDGETHALRTLKGDLYLPYDRALIQEQAWARCDENGKLVNKSGKPVSQPSEVCFLSIDELAEQAQVHPCGDHFFDAGEEAVDSLRCLWQGSDYRAHLIRVSPPLYRIARQFDQMCINRCYPPSGDSAGLIRSSAGELVENNDQNRNELLQFEQKCK